MDKVSNCIRMAMAINTEGSFIVKQPFTKLYQKTCDGRKYNKLAPYIDVFKLN
jgi:hypothetical protein